MIMHNFPSVKIRDDVPAADLAKAVAGMAIPVVFKGAVKAWPAVQKAGEPLDAAQEKAELQRKWK